MLWNTCKKYILFSGNMNDVSKIRETDPRSQRIRAQEISVTSFPAGITAVNLSIAGEVFAIFCRKSMAVKLESLFVPWFFLYFSGQKVYITGFFLSRRCVCFFQTEVAAKPWCLLACPLAGMGDQHQVHVWENTYIMQPKDSIVKIVI